MISQLDLIILLFLSILLVIISIGIVERSGTQQNIWIRVFKRILIAIISFYQGYVFSILLNLLLLAFNNFYNELLGIQSFVFDVTILTGIFAAVYYILITDKYFGIKAALQNLRKRTDQNKELICEELEQFILSTNIMKGNLKFYEFTDDICSFNAFILRPNNIFLGRDFNERATISEKKFVIAHELSHSVLSYNKKMSFYIILFALLLCGLSKFQLITLQNKILFGIFQILIFLISLLLIHKIVWNEEFRADYLAIKITRDPKSALSFFTMALSIENELLEIEKEEDYGCFNLLLFDHPLTKDRMKKIQNLST